MLRAILRRVARFSGALSMRVRALSSPKVRRSAGSPSPPADDQGLRIPGRGDLARRFLDDSGCGVARERSDPMTNLRIGIASYKEMKARTMAVARGERRLAAHEPKVWFTSTESFA